MFKAYLEDFYDIKIIAPIIKAIDQKAIYAKIDDELISLFCQNYYHINNEEHLYLKSPKLLEPHKDITIVTNIGEEHLSLGKITRSPLFEEKYYFNDWLGYQYTKEATKFRIWSPVAKEVRLVIDNKFYPLVYQDQGVWQITISKDLEGAKYHYNFRINEEFIDTLDPYAKSSLANSKENYVIDLNKTYQMTETYFTKPNFKANQAIIYEINIRDATSKTNLTNKGTFKAFEDTKDLKIGLGYLKDLNITHIQLLPVMSFGGVDENIKDSNDANFQYNWGYNPMEYFVPSGFLASDAQDPYCKINELKKLIDTIHKLKMGVNLDVVYNHVYDRMWFPFERLVPGYTFRTDEKDFLTNSSWCGNDLKTDHLMIRKLIIDSVLFLQTFYKVDGFRFDLMGLIDIETMKQLTKEVMKNNPLAMIYGEGWEMDVALPEKQRANMSNAYLLTNIAFFNDYFRNLWRGNEYQLGYLDQKKFDKKLVLKLIKGYTYQAGEFQNALQSINYVECHDNHTLYDLLKIKHPQFSEEKLIDLARLALGITVLSCGICFIHAGQELLRTKKLYHNSYNLDDEINGINWQNVPNLTESLKDLLKIRQSISSFKLSEKQAIDQCFKLDDSFELPVVRITTSNYEIYQMIISNDYLSHTKYFAPNTYLIYDGKRLTLQNVQRFEINKPGVYLFKK